MKNLVELIQTTIKESGLSSIFVGFRTLTNDENYKVGDTPRNSYEWDVEEDCSTYYTTGLTCDGVCTIGGQVDKFDDAEEIEAMLAKWTKGVALYSGNQVALLFGFDEGTYLNQDEGELRIADATVLAMI